MTHLFLVHILQKCGNLNKLKKKLNKIKTLNRGKKKTSIKIKNKKENNLGKRKITIKQEKKAKTELRKNKSYQPNII